MNADLNHALEQCERAYKEFLGAANSLELKGYSYLPTIKRLKNGEIEYIRGEVRKHDACK